LLAHYPENLIVQNQQSYDDINLILWPNTSIDPPPINTYITTPNLIERYRAELTIQVVFNINARLIGRFVIVLRWLAAYKPLPLHGL
jgi:hypothetical protein